MKNIDRETVDSFGEEWARFAQDRLSKEERRMLFERYFANFPWDSMPSEAEGFDMGCGSGRWAALVAPRVGRLNVVEPSPRALDVARRNLADFDNVRFINASTSDCAIPTASQDFGYSLGVLHHVPNTREAMRACVGLLKPGAPFLVYLYYRFDNKPRWYRGLWKLSDVVRRQIVRLPERAKSLVTDAIALVVYYPLACVALLGSRFGLNVENWPLASYRACSLYTMRTDSRDRFGTPLERRFTRIEIETMMKECGLEGIVFSEDWPYWCAVGKKGT